MQLHIRGQQTHVLEVQPSETIEIVKVSRGKLKDPADISLGDEMLFVTIPTSARSTSAHLYEDSDVKQSTSLERWPYRIQLFQSMA